MRVLQRGQAGHVLVLDVGARRAELGNGGVQVAGVPQHHGVEDQAQGGEPVLSELAQRGAELISRTLPPRKVFVEKLGGPASPGVDARGDALWHSSTTDHSKIM